MMPVDFEHLDMQIVDIDLLARERGPEQGLTAGGQSMLRERQERARLIESQQVRRAGAAAEDAIVGEEQPGERGVHAAVIPVDELR